MSQAAGKTLDLLVAVVRSTRPRGLIELATETGIDKSTSARLLSLLVERGFLARDEETRRFEIGPETLGLLASIGSRMDVRSVAANHLPRLRDVAGETVSLHLRLGRQRVCVDGAESEHPVRRVVPIGESLPLHAGPSGKVMLAFLPDAEQRLILAAAGEAGADLSALRAQLQTFADQRFAMTVSDRTQGVRAVSAAVFGARGVAASITIAGPSDRWSEATATGCVPTLLDAARTVTAALGGRIPERVS